MAVANNTATYLVEVRSDDGVGDGTATAPISVVPATAPAAAALPVVTGGSGVVTWALPASDGGAPITGYDVSAVVLPAPVNFNIHTGRGRAGHHADVDQRPRLLGRGPRRQLCRIWRGQRRRDADNLAGGAVRAGRISRPLVSPAGLHGRQQRCGSSITYTATVSTIFVLAGIAGKSRRVSRPPSDLVNPGVPESTITLPLIDGDIRTRCLLSPTTPTVRAGRAACSVLSQPPSRCSRPLSRMCRSSAVEVGSSRHSPHCPSSCRVSASRARRSASPLLSYLRSRWSV